MNVLINIHGPFYNPKKVVTGNSLRAYSLGNTLREKDFEVKYLIQKDFIKDNTKIDRNEVLIYDEKVDFIDKIRKETPDAVIFIQGENLEFLKGTKSDFIVIGDFIAPSLIEYTFQDLSFEEWFFKFTTRISQCDYLICSTERQKAYYLNLLMCSGFDIKEERIKILPISSKNINIDSNNITKPVKVVMGGISWPWIDPSKYLKRFIEIIENKSEEIELTIFKGKYPFRIKSKKYKEGFKEIETKRNVIISEFLPYSELLKKYGESHLAFDLFERNVERELSFSFRNIDYLNCGLPIISVDFTTMSGFIERYDAGWNVKDIKDLNKVVEEICDLEILKRKKKNAKKLFKEKFDIEKNIETLIEILKKGKKRKNNKNFIELFSPFFENTLSEISHLKEKVEKLEKENTFLKKEKEKLNEAFNNKEKDHISTISVVNEQKKYIEKIEENLKNSLKLINEKDISLKEQEHIIEDLKKYSIELEEKISHKDKTIEELKTELEKSNDILSKKMVRFALKIDGFFRGEKK